MKGNIMTKTEIMNNARSLKTNHQHIEHLKIVVDYFEKLSSCDGCEHKPKKGENFPESCSTCCRWYGDGYKVKREEKTL